MSVTSNKKTEPAQTKPKASTEEPKHAKLLKDMNKSKWSRSKANITNSRRATLWTKSGGPKCVLSMVDSVDTGPIQDNPKSKSIKSIRAED